MLLPGIERVAEGCIMDLTADTGGNLVLKPVKKGLTALHELLDHHQLGIDTGEPLVDGTGDTETVTHPQQMELVSVTLDGRRHLLGIVDLHTA